MQTRLLKTAGFTLALLPVLTLASCSHGIKGTETESVVQTAEGTTIVDTYTVDGTVTAIDPAKHTVTLTGPHGGTQVCKAGKGVNFDALKVGDTVKATLTEKVAVQLQKGVAPESAGEGDAVALAARGNTSEVFMGDTRELTAKVTAVDTKSRKVTLQFVDGKSDSFKVGPKIDLNNVKLGDDVVARLTEAVAIDITGK
jgi:hypothetical protein